MYYCEPVQPCIDPNINCARVNRILFLPTTGSSILNIVIIEHSDLFVQIIMGFPFNSWVLSASIKFEDSASLCFTILSKQAKFNFIIVLLVWYCQPRKIPLLRTYSRWFVHFVQNDNFRLVIAKVRAAWCLLTICVLSLRASHLIQCDTPSSWSA